MCCTLLIIMEAVQEFVVEFRPEAMKRFEELSQSLLPLGSSTAMSAERSQGFQPEFHIAAQISEEDIHGWLYGLTEEPDGRPSSMSARKAGKTFTLEGDQLITASKIADQLCAMPEIREVIGKRKVLDFVFKWAHERTIETTDEAFLDFFLQKLKDSVRTHEIWIPIRWLHPEMAFEVGHVTFAPLDAAWFDRLLPKPKGDPTDQDKAMTRKVAEWRGTLQGHAAAVVSVKAEPEHARVRAYELTEQSLDILKLYSRGAMHSNAVTTVAPFEKELQDGYLCFFPHADGFRISTGGALGNEGWTVTAADLDSFGQLGLGLLSKALIDPERTEYLHGILRSAHWYSRGSSSLDPGDRLVFVLRALESFLLTSDQGTIAQTLAERVALVAGKTADERLTIIKNFKKVYGFRSRLVHQGLSFSDQDELREFYKTSWFFMMQAIRLSQLHQTRESLVESLEKQKFS